MRALDLPVIENVTAKVQVLESYESNWMARAHMTHRHRTMQLAGAEQEHAAIARTSPRSNQIAQFCQSEQSIPTNPCLIFR